MSKITKYQVELTYCTHHLHKVVHEFATPAEVNRWLTLPNDVDLILFIAALGRNVDYGSFYLFLNKNNAAHIWPHEHREHIPVEPDAHDSKKNVRIQI